MSNKRFYDKLKRPPKTALKEIKGGRMNGKTDINPQWRYEAMTEVFGPCGIGWYYEVTRKWLEAFGADTVAAFVDVNLYVKEGDEWSKPIPGTGGSMFVAKEKAGPYVSDECYKMATTDALSVAMKMLGMAGDIYAGAFDGSKYRDAQPEPRQAEPLAASPAVPAEPITEALASDYEGRWGEYPLPAKLSKPTKGQLQMLTIDEWNKLEAWSKKHPEYAQLAIAVSHYTLPF